MTYAIEILRSADKFLEKLSRQQPHDAAAIEDAIEDLGDEPRPHGSTTLKGYSGIWRVRVGNYRVCYRIEDRQLLILVITISTRDNVYEVLRRYIRR